MARDRENPYELGEIILGVQLWNSLSNKIRSIEPLAVFDCNFFWTER